MDGGDAESGHRGPSATERAEELLTRAGIAAGFFANMAGMRAARIAAFAREEVEDMLAEARAVRERGLISEVREDAGRVREGAAGLVPDEGLRVTRSEGVTPSDGDGAEARGATEEPQVAAGTEATGPVAGMPLQAYGGAEEVKATAAARRRAEQLGVDLGEVQGTGANGQITVEDVRKAAEAGK